MNRLKQKIKAKINNGKEDKQMHVTAVTARAISVSDQDIGELFLPFKPELAKKSHLIWLDRNIDQVNNDDCRHTITTLKDVADHVNTFTDIDQCISFIASVNGEETVLISSGGLGQKIVPAIHNISQIKAIYIFCDNATHHEKWAKQWPKVKGVYTDITHICDALLYAK
jgi:hypothetical protein